MISPQFRIQISSFFEDLRQLKALPQSNYYISLLLSKNYQFIDNISSFSSKNTKDFEYNWKIIKNIKQSNELLILINLKIFSKRSKNKFNLSFLIYENLNEFVMILSNLKYDERLQINYFMNSFYPDLTRFYLIHDELFNILISIEEKFHYKLVSDKYYVSKKFGNKPEKDIKIREGKYYRDCFLDASRKNKFLEKIRLNNFDSYQNIKGGKPYYFNLRRDGQISLYHGNFDNLILNLIEEILKFAEAKYQILKDRSRIKTMNEEIKPLLIEFFSSPFKEKAGIDILIEILKEYPNCSYAIIHAGNPYLEMMFVDYEDKSSFSLVTFSNNSLIIYPQLYASESALFKLFAFITKKFSDGNLHDYEEYKKSMEIST